MNFFLQNRYRLKLFVFFAVALSAPIIFQSHGAALAAPTYSSMPQQLAADGQSKSNSDTVIHLSTDRNDASGYGKKIATITVKLYNQKPTLDSSDKSVHLHQIASAAAGGCNDAISMVYQITNNANPSNPSSFGDQYATSYSSKSSDGPKSCGNTLDFFVPQDAWIQRLDGIKEATVSFTLESGGTADLRYIESNGATRLGWAGGSSVPIDTCNPTGDSTCGSSGTEYTMAVVFGTPRSTCGNGVKSSIFWSDDDFGLAPESPNATNMRASAFRINSGGGHGSRAGGVLDSLRATSAAEGFGAKGVGRMFVGLSSGGSYSLEFSNVNRGNTIVVDYPYDSGDYYIDNACPPTSQPPSSVAECQAFIYGTAANSIYKFSIFPVPNSAPGYNPPYSNGDGNHTFAATSQWSGYPGQQPVDQKSYTNSTNGTVNYSYVFPPPSASGWFVLVERWEHVLSKDTWTYRYAELQSYDCYSANCTLAVDGFLDSSDPSKAAANQSYTAKMTVNNTGKQPINKLGWDGSADATGGNSMSFVINGRNTVPDIPLSPSPVSPSSVGYYVLNGAVYYGSYKVADCTPATVRVYEPFNVNAWPSTTLKPTTENPSTVDYRSWLIHNSGPSVDIPVTSTYQKDGATRASFSGIKTSNPPNGNEDNVLNNTDASLGPVAAGTTFCTNITISTQTGYRGPGGSNDVIPNNDGTSHSDCPRVHNSPYVHNFNSDASAGGGFGKSCTPTKGGIQTYTRTTGTQPAGSGVQVGALSIGPVNGFSSANLRTSTPTALNGGLTFANTGITPATGEAPYLGGDLGDNHCVTDYYGAEPDGTSVSSVSQLDLGGVAGAVHIKPVGGVLTINPNGVSNIFKKNIAIYVDGDVVIKNDVRYRDADIVGGYGGIEDIPTVYIIAEGKTQGKGNIYVDPGVKQLDGLYVAQPRDSTATDQGIIYTCASGTTPYDDPALLGVWLSTCKQQQLVVNGSFVAQHVHLLRTFGSIRDSGSYPGEHLFGRPSVSCSDSGSSSLGDCAAEIFNFDPSVYLAAPAITPLGGPTTGTYQYITSLSPVL
jgi:hypothetical protein